MLAIELVADALRIHATRHRDETATFITGEDTYIRNAKMRTTRVSSGPVTEDLRVEDVDVLLKVGAKGTLVKGVGNLTDEQLDRITRTTPRARRGRTRNGQRRIHNVHRFITKARERDKSF